MNLIHRLSGIVVVAAFFTVISVVLIHYTKPAPLPGQLNEMQPTIDFDMDEDLQNSVDGESRNKAMSIEKPALDAQLGSHKLLESTQWRVQVGTFAQIENANRLLKKLEQNGFKASTRSVVIKDKSLTQVIVGFGSHYTEAQLLAKRLDETLQLKGRIISVHAQS